MKKIIYVNSYSIIGGAERSLQSIILSMRNKNIEPILVLGERGNLVEWCIEKKIKFKIIPQPSLGNRSLISRFFYLSIFTLRFFTFMILNNCNVIHTNTTRSRLYCSIVACLPFINSVAHVRDIERLTVNSFLVRMYNTTIVISKAVMNTVNLDVSPDFRYKVKLIYNGVENYSDNSECIDSATHFSSERLCKVGMFARFEDWKGQDLFIKSLIKLLDSGVNVEGYIYGDALRESEVEFKEYCLKLVPPSLSTKIKFMGVTSEPISSIKNLDLIVCPSLNEPFGRVLIEAMSCSKPVVCSKGGGFLEILDDRFTILYFKQGDVCELSKKIRDFIDNPIAFNSLVDELHSHFYARFSLETLVERILKLY